MHKANKYNTPTHLCCILKLLASDRNFADENLPDYVIGFVNSSE